jgi:hypothetical protein
MNDLADPRDSLGAPDVDYLATLKDASELARIFEEEGYTAGTAAQAMTAMDKLDGLYDAALQRRSILPGGGVGQAQLPGGQMRLGLPMPQGVEVSETYKRTAKFTASSAVQQLDALVEREAKDAQIQAKPDDVYRTIPGPTVPTISEPEASGPGPSDRAGDGDDDYYSPDEAGDDLFRPPAS